MIQKLAFFALGTALMAMAGCVSTATGGLEVSLKENDGPFRVRVDDGFFSQHIDVEESAVRRESTGFLNARVLVRNKLGRDFPVQYKFRWFDGDGMEVQPDGRPWEQKVLHGGEAASLSATAPEKSAVGFVVRLRRVR